MQIERNQARLSSYCYANININSEDLYIFLQNSLEINFFVIPLRCITLLVHTACSFFATYALR